MSVLLQSDVPGVPCRRGKVRDVYDLGDRLVLVATDRISAFDVVLPTGIPDKGKILTALTLFWLETLGVENHLIGTDPLPGFEPLAGRLCVVQKAKVVPIECVVRGYLAGSGWIEYQASQSVCGVPLPAGLVDGDRLPEPIYTPAFKAEQGEHDENITFERTVELVGEDVAAALRDASLEVFARASAIAEQRGVLLADTKFEWGADPDTGALTLGDEVLTSDSSRYWDAERYETGDRTASFDKQIVRNWLLANWDREGIPPRLPQEIVEQTAARYRELIERLTS